MASPETASGSISELEDGDEYIEWVEEEVEGVKVLTGDDLPNPLIGLRVRTT
jgi:hypothetical protein